MRRRSKSFEIALSAMACAIAAGCLTLGSYVDFMLAAGYLLAIFALMIPLSKDFIWGHVLALAASVLLAFLFCGFAFLKLVPFVAFFGLHPLANYLEKRFVKKKILHLPCILAKAVWFDLAMWLSFRLVFVPIFGLNAATWYPFVERYFFLILFLGGTVVFVFYDYLIFLCQRSVNLVVARIRR